MITLPLLLQTVVGGILLGTIYGAMALGLSLTMGVLRVINVAHSTFVILGSFGAYFMVRRLGLDPLLSVLPAIPLLFGFGMLIERTVVQRVVRAPQSVGLLVLFGVMVVLESVMILLWTTDTRAVTSPVYGGEVLIVGPLRLTYTRLAAAALAVTAIGAVHLLLTRTMTGKAIRALGQGRDAAAIMGIKVNRLMSMVFGLGVAMAGVGGVTLAMVFPFTPQDHIRWLAWAFLIVIVGGLGSVGRTLGAGVFVGVVEALSGILFPFAYVFVILYAILALALVVRKEGLMGPQARTI
jgi:branched-chain amino acid transport system permease protein